MNFTAQEAIEQLAPFNGAKGRCADDPSALDHLNKVRRFIYGRNLDVEGVMTWAVVNPDKAGRYILPLEVGVVRAAFRCSTPIPIHNSNHWLVSKDSLHGCGCESWGLQQMLKTRPYSIVPPVSPFVVAVMAHHQDDNNKELRFKGVVKSAGVTMTQSESVKLKFMEMVETSLSFVELDSVTKSVLAGDVTVYARGVTGKCLIAQYPAASTHPSFIYYRSPTGEVPTHQAAFYCRKKFQPIIDLNEMVDIPSIQALINGAIALNANVVRNVKDFAENVQLMENALDKADGTLNSGGSEVVNLGYNLALDSYHG